MKNFLPFNFDASKAKKILQDNTNFVIIDNDKKIIFTSSAEYKNYIFDDNLMKYLGKDEIYYLTKADGRYLIFPYDFYGKKYYIITSSRIAQYTMARKFLDIYFFIVFVILLIGIYILYLREIKKQVRYISEFDKVIKKINQRSLNSRLEDNYNNVVISHFIDTINGMLFNLEKNFKRVNQFTSDLAHELRTPIASIKNMIEVELNKDRSKEEYQLTLIKVLEESNSLADLIKDLLYLENMEGENFQKKKINLNKLVNGIVDLLEIVALDKNIEINVELPFKSYIMGDEIKLKRVLINLLSNSIKYNKENGNIFIAVYYDDSKRITVSIKDTGIGIKKENLDKVFTRFFREDKVRTTKKEGLGLGLSMVKEILDLHEAVLDVNSQLGIGSEFIIHFKN